MATRPRRRWRFLQPPDRVMSFLTEKGPIWVAVRDQDTASLLGLHANAVRRYLEYGDEQGLLQFAGRMLEIGNRRLPFLTDLATLDQLASAGELHYELYRR